MSHQYGDYYGGYPPSGPPTNGDGPELAAAKAEIAVLKAENAALKAQLAERGGGGAPPAHLPPPNFYAPPSYGGYYGGYPPSYPPHGYTPPPAYSALPARGPPQPANPPLAINAENRRGPKGANLALFCIPNSYTDQLVYDLAKPYGEVIFASVATHRDSGLSRGYAFVSYNTIAEAETAMSALHNLTVEGRALRCEVARSDKESSASKPY
jgi:hypothetical protein